MEPLLKQQGLKGGGHYVEYRTDDARLTIEVLKEAVNQGAKAVNYAKVEKLLYSQGKVIGVHLTDQLSGKGYDVYARKIVNAAGPWVDTLREMDQSKQGKTLQLTKGIHLVIDQKKFPLQQAVYFDTPDKRMVFAIPRNGKTYVGTTDTVFKEDIAHPRMTMADRKYVIDAINYMFPSVKVTVNDVESSWAGVRPLIHEEGKDPSEISRKDEIWQSDSGLLTIAGGKLTGYRKMAELIVDRVAVMFQQVGYGSFPASNTKHIPISGGDVGGSIGFPSFISSKREKGAALGLNPEIASAWAEMYGSNVDRLYEISQLYKEEGTASGLPLDVFVHLRYAIQEEMAVKPVDFFVRRTGALYFNIQWVSQWKSAVIAYMAQYLNWTSDQTQLFTTELESHMHDTVVTVDEGR
jgi:glycerol-3-phosphate dehydrogenase